MTPVGPSPAGDPWLLAVDLQLIFGAPGSPWFAPRFDAAAAATLRLADAFGSRTAYTRFLAPTPPTGAWVRYYEQWAFALDPANAPLYELTPELAGRGGVRIERSTFGKWDEAARASLGGTTQIVLTGVSTDCCVLSTALAAADAGVHVRVVADACAGASDADHLRALDAMALYGPLIEVTTVDEVLASR